MAKPDIGLAEARGYLAGIFDGEGGIQVRGKAGSHRLTVCTNTEASIIEWTCLCLDVCGIPYHVRERRKTASIPAHHKRVWNVTINARPDIELFAAMIPIRSAPKLERFAQLQAMPRRKPVPDKTELHSLYVECGYSIGQLMRHYGVLSTATIHYWLRSRGIPRRTGSDATRRSWDDGLRREAHAVS